jgi:hypothetical protein
VGGGYGNGAGELGRVRDGSAAVHGGARVVFRSGAAAIGRDVIPYARSRLLLVLMERRRGNEQRSRVAASSP